MKRHFVWILATSVLIELLSLASIILAEEGKWTKRADMPTARWGLSTCAINGKIYAIGGMAGDTVAASKPLSTMEEYDPATDTWTRKEPMPNGRSSLSTSVVNGKIYAIGGDDFRGLPTEEEYNPVTDKWTKIADMPTARNWLSTSVVNGKIYAIGGRADQTILSTVEVYDTGFAVEAKDKLATSWGKLKARD